MIYNMRGDTYHAGPVRLSDVYTYAIGSAMDGVAASQRALYKVYDSLNSSITTINIDSVQRITTTVTTGNSGNIATQYSNDGYHFVFAPHTSGNSVFLRAWVSPNNGGWYLTAIDPNSGNTLNNTSLQVRYLLLKIKKSS